MPATSPEAIENKKKRAKERKKERMKNDPEFRKKVNKRKLERQKEKRAEYRKNNPFKKDIPEYRVWKNAWRGAIKRGIPFEITVEDICIPAMCPVLGIPLFFCGDAKSANTPSVDRIDNSKGYYKDNIWVISFRANALKRDSSFEELEMLYLGMKKKLSESC